jgi:hypothetical protein
VAAQRLIADAESSLALKEQARQRNTPGGSPQGPASGVVDEELGEGNIEDDGMYFFASSGDDADDFDGGDD